MDSHVGQNTNYLKLIFYMFVKYTITYIQIFFKKNCNFFLQFFKRAEPLQLGAKNKFRSIRYYSNHLEVVVS